jgi:signal transduction histidine kinase
MPDRYADARPRSPVNGTRTSPLTLLLVEADGGRAERMAHHLRRALPGVVATRCASLASARAYLAGTAFDAVCTAAVLPDGEGTALLDVRDALGLRAPVFVWTPGGGLRPDRARVVAAACFHLDGADEASAADAIGRALGGGSAEPGAAPDEAPTALASGLLEALRAETGAVAHAINNPLTVIAGNAQFLGEMARTEGLAPVLVRSIEDIEAATQQLSDALDRLAVLRQRIADALGVSDRL